MSNQSQKIPHVKKYSQLLAGDKYLISGNCGHLLCTVTGINYTYSLFGLIKKVKVFYTFVESRRDIDSPIVFKDTGYGSNVYFANRDIILC